MTNTSRPVSSLPLPAATVVALVAMAGAACVTIKVYFPEARIQKLSDQIEAEVERQGGAEAEAPPTAAPAPAPPAPEGMSGGLLWWESLIGVEVAHAQEEVPLPSATSPAIRKIIESRAARLTALRRLKNMGAIGESNKGLLEPRNSEAVTDLAQRAEMQRLVKQENDDRELLYREIATAEGVAASQLPRIRETYAATIRERARTGDLLQLPEGTWIRKE